MPSITLTNARSLNNKMDELCALIKHDSDYRMSNLVCVTETWFNAKEEEKDINKPVLVSDDIDGFTSVRLDRDHNKTAKEKEGGLVMFVNKQWASNITIRETHNTPDYEILSVSFRPFYLPREFTQVTVILSYVPGPDEKAAGE